jgi:hypothetical protein
MSSFCAVADSNAPVLPDTGQSVQYDTEGKVLAESDSSFYTGQDASVQGNVPRYQDNDDGTVTDLNTGLMWQKAHDFTRRNISNSRYPSVIRASQICEGFDFYRHNHTLQALKACPNTA